MRIEYAPDDFVDVESLGDLNRLRIRIGDADLLGGSELMQLTASAGGALPGSLASELLVADASHDAVFGFAGDDHVVPFEVGPLDVRGRIVQLGPMLDQILGRHDYPEPVARLLVRFDGSSAPGSEAGTRTGRRPPRRCRGPPAFQ